MQHVHLFCILQSGSSENQKFEDSFGYYASVTCHARVEIRKPPVWMTSGQIIVRGLEFSVVSVAAKTIWGQPSDMSRKVLIMLGQAWVTFESFCSDLHHGSISSKSPIGYSLLYQLASYCPKLGIFKCIQLHVPSKPRGDLWGSFPKLNER